MRSNFIFIVLCCLFSLSTLHANHSTPKHETASKDKAKFQKATFPGGEEALKEFIASEMIYPKKAREAIVEGEVKVIFAVGSDGQVFDVKVVEGVGYGCNEEAVRIIKAMPRWNPARLGKETAGMRLDLSIVFTLSNK